MTVRPPLQFSNEEDLHLFPQFYLKSLALFKMQHHEISTRHTLNYRSYHAALCTTAIIGSGQVARAILKITGPEILEYGDGIQRTPLVWAVIHTNPHIVRLFMEWGANPNTTSHKKTPLWFALRAHKIIVAKILMIHGGVVYPTLKNSQAEITAKNDLKNDAHVEALVIQPFISKIPLAVLEIIAAYTIT